MASPPVSALSDRRAAALLPKVVAVPRLVRCAAAHFR